MTGSDGSGASVLVGSDGGVQFLTEFDAGVCLVAMDAVR